MKKNLLNSILVIAFVLGFGVSNLHSQTLLVEDFDYPIGALLTSNGWTAHSGGGTNPIDVTTGLSFAGYAGSGIGGSANVDNTGEDVNKTFTAQTSGNVYVAFVIQTSAPNNAGYFLNLGQSTIGTTFFSRVWVNATGDGVGIGTSVASYIPVSVGVPTLLVVKYEIATKVSNLFVFGSMPTEEPATPNSTFTETGTYSNVGSIALRQYNAAQRIIVDGIRIGTSWADVISSTASNVATPTFDPPAGTYTTPQDVLIATTTPDATIYYTTDGTDPNTGSSQYFNPIPVSTTTTIKAIAYADGMEPSAIASATYTFITVSQVATIAELRASATGSDIYELTGEAVLTFKQTNRNQKFIQDATAGVLIDDPTGLITTVYNVGDGITGIKGTLTDYNGMLEFVPVEDPGTASSTGNTVFPQEITLTEFNTNFENYESELVSIVGVTFANAGQTFANGTVYSISDASADATSNFRTAFYSVDYIGTLIPAYEVNLVAIPNTYQNLNYLTSRNLADITPTSSAPTLIVNSPNGGELWEQGGTYNITWTSLNFTDNVKIELTGLLVPFVISASAPNTGTFSWTIPVNQSTTPNYKVRISNAAGGSPTDLSDDFFHISAPLPDPEIVINEIHYNPSTAQGVDTDWEYLELYNKSTFPVDISGWTIPGVSFTVPTGTTLAANAYVAIAVKPTNITAYYGVTNVLGPYTGALNNSGEALLLKDATGVTKDSVWYLPSAPWPTTPNGSGPSLELINPEYDNALPVSWAASTAQYGTPGTQNSVFVGGGSITVTNPVGGEAWETGTSQNITWTAVSFSGNVKIELVYPDGSTETLGTGISAEAGTWTWNIPSSQLIADSLKIKISDEVDGDPEGTSLGFISIIAPVELPNLVINEIMYNSTGFDYEWIELYNNSYETVDLEGYQILDNNNNNPKIIITEGHSIAPWSYFTISIDSAAGALPLTFIPDFDGRGSFTFDNGGDQVRLFHSSGLLIDQVEYDDAAPWPTEPDGTGPSLALLSPELDNSIAENWAASQQDGGTPGAVNFTYEPTITVTAPNGGENIIQGTTFNITWTQIDCTGDVNIELITSSKAGVAELLGTVPVTTGTFAWVVSQEPGTFYKIRISGIDAPNPIDESDAVFSISQQLNPTITVTSPNGGESWEQGSTHNITWTASDFTGLVKIELNDGAKGISQLATDVAANAGTWSWMIPVDQTIGSNYTIIISDVQTGNPTDVSDAPFSVVAPPPAAQIVITEIMFNPPEVGTDSLEYIELYNAGLNAVNLAGWTFSLGIVFTFPDYTLNPGSYVLVAVNSTALFNLLGVNSLQWTSGALGNGGEPIELKNASGVVMDYVNYDDVAPWPVAADDFGPSLVLCDPSLDNNDGSNWTTAVEFLAKNTLGIAIYGNPNAGCSLNDAQRINIPGGWSGISSFINPTNPNVMDVFNPMVNDLVILQDFSQVYWPGMAVNTIGNWNTQRGYVIKTTKTAPAYTYFANTGTTDADKTIELTAGWNLLPVPVNCDVDATTLFSAYPDIVIVKDVAGTNVWWPGVSTYTLTTLKPGVAYYILVNSAISISFPDCVK